MEGKVSNSARRPCVLPLRVDAAAAEQPPFGGRRRSASNDIYLCDNGHGQALKPTQASHGLRPRPLLNLPAVPSRPCM